MLRIARFARFARFAGGGARVLQPATRTRLLRRRRAAPWDESPTGRRFLRYQPPTLTLALSLRGRGDRCTPHGVLRRRRGGCPHPPAGRPERRAVGRPLRGRRTDWRVRSPSICRRHSSLRSVPVERGFSNPRRTDRRVRSPLSAMVPRDSSTGPERKRCKRCAGSRKTGLVRGAL